jgi:hypothetical protein
MLGNFMSDYRNFKGELVTNCPKGEGYCWEPEHLTKEQYESQVLNNNANSKNISSSMPEALIDDPTDDIISVNEYSDSSTDDKAKQEFPVKLVKVSRVLYHQQLLEEIQTTKKQLRAAKFSGSDEAEKLEDKQRKQLAEEKLILQMMKEECWRCYGTGNMDGLQIDKDLSSPYCEECGTSNYMQSPSFVTKAQEVKGSMYKSALDKYAVKLTDACQKCGEASLAPHEIRGGFLKRTVIGTRIRCQSCSYDQKDLSFIHSS